MGKGRLNSGTENPPPKLLSLRGQVAYDNYVVAPGFPATANRQDFGTVMARSSVSRIKRV